MKSLICCRATVCLAPATLFHRRGATSAANSPMMVTTTSSSISVIPLCLCDFSRFIESSEGNVVHADDRQEHGKHHHSHHQPGGENHQWLEERGSAADGGA